MRRLFTFLALGLLATVLGLALATWAPRSVLIALLVILLIALLLAIAWYFYMIVQDEAECRRLLRERVKGRMPKPVDRILDEDWPGQAVERARFQQLWALAASCFQVDPELLRPGDVVEDLAVLTQTCWCFWGDYITDFFEDALPGIDANGIEMLDKSEFETVADLMTIVIDHEGTAQRNTDG